MSCRDAPFRLVQGHGSDSEARTSAREQEIGSLEKKQNGLILYLKTEENTIFIINCRKDVKYTCFLNMRNKDRVSGNSKVRKRERQLYLYSGCDQASAIPRTCLRSARPHHPSEYTQACPSNPHVPMGAKGRKPSP